MRDINMTSFFANQKSWYVQEQMTVIYQREADLYCVRDTYTQLMDRTLDLTTHWKKRDSDKWSVAHMNGYIEDLNNPSHFLVGPKLIPNFLRGPYWIIDAGVGRDGAYDWMIVSGGAPKNLNRSNGKCQTGRLLNESGLWLFTSKAFGVADRVVEMRRRLFRDGFDLTVLLKVDHTGCGYE